MRKNGLDGGRVCVCIWAQICAVNFPSAHTQHTKRKQFRILSASYNARRFILLQIINQSAIFVECFAHDEVWRRIARLSESNN